MSNTDSLPEKEIKDKIVIIISIALTFGICGILLFGFNSCKILIASVIANSLLFAGSSFFIGVLLGFLFGVPRTLQGENQPENGAGNGISYKVNTNLEQISDWLTKILVGVSLTQLTNLPTYLSSLSHKLILVFGNESSSGVYGVSIIVYYIVIGFLSGFMLTRIYVGRIFRDADKGYLEKKIEELQRQPDLDANALDIANQLLSPTPTAKTFTEQEAIDAFGKASQSARFTIFTQAERIRRNNWRSNKPFMEKTIPVFKALTLSENDQKNHRYFGQLGYALKDKETPDYVESEKTLSIAINIRGNHKYYGYSLYEFCRSICLINMDENFKQDKPSSDTIAKAITNDLNALRGEVNFSEFNNFVQSTPEVSKWLKVNNISIS